MNLRRRIMSPSLAALRLQCTPRQSFKLAAEEGFEPSHDSFQRRAPFHLATPQSSGTQLDAGERCSIVAFVPHHITFGHRGANTDYAPSVFAFYAQELILLCELGRDPRDLFRAPAPKSALRICLHVFPSFQ